MSDTSEESGLVLGLVNGLVIKKEHFQIEIYPELINTAKEFIHLMEITYEDGIRKGMERSGDDSRDDNSPPREESPEL